MSSRWRRISGPSSGRTARRRQVELVELGERGLEDEIAPGGLKPLHEIAGAGVEHAVSRFDQGMADCAEDMRLARAGIADGDQVAAALQPVAGRESLDPGVRQGWQRLEVEGRQCLAGGQLRLVQMAPDAARVALGQFIFRQNGEEAGGGPAFGIGARGDFQPELVEARQAQRGQHAGQRVDVDLTGGHARAPSRASKLSSGGWATAISLGNAMCLGVSRDASVLGSGT